MSTYTAQDGDTFERVSTIAYGSADYAARIREANPQAAGGIAAGMVLNLPELFELPPIAAPSIPAESVNEVEISVGGQRFRFWTEVEIERSIDNLDTFRFGAPFEVQNTELRELFKPMSFRDVAIDVGGERLFTGTLVDVTPSAEESARIISASGYARAGVLNDCTPPGQTDVLEFDSMDLRQIAGDLSKPFGLKPVFTSDPGPALDRVSIGATTKIATFLRKLAQQRNLVIGSTTRGNPLFQRTTSVAAVQSLVEGEPPLRSVSTRFRPQEFYSHITALTPPTIGSEGTGYTVENPSLRGTVRPFTFRADDTFGADGSEAANAKIGRMFGNAVAYTARVAGWRNAAGALWAPNTRVRLVAPGAMVYRETEFLIRRVGFRGTAASQAVSLGLVLPESFEGKVPEVFPWE